MSTFYKIFTFIFQSFNSIHEIELQKISRNNAYNYIFLHNLMIYCGFKCDFESIK